MSTVIGLYRPGSSIVHALPAGLKLSALIVAGAASLLIRTPGQTAAALGTVLVGYLAARIPLREVLRSLRPMLWVIAPLLAFQGLVVGWSRASVIVGVIVALVLLANLVTFTTLTSDLVDVAVRACRPVRWVGVDPERVGLTLNVAIRAVPLVIELAAQCREAQHARGLSASPRAFAVPLVVGALRRADQLGDALAARGFDD